MQKFLLAFLLLTACAARETREIIYPAPVPEVEKDKIQNNSAPDNQEMDDNQEQDNEEM